MNKPPTWFWVVAVIALLWAGMGCWSYLNEVTMTPDDLAKLPVAQREAWAAMPKWLFGVFAIAVWSALAAAIAMVLRRRIARTLYIVSLVAIVVQFGWLFVMTPMLKTMGFAEAAGVPIVIAVAGAVLIWFSGMAAQRGWLR